MPDSGGGKRTLLGGPCYALLLRTMTNAGRAVSPHLNRIGLCSCFRNVRMGWMDRNGRLCPAHHAGHQVGVIDQPFLDARTETGQQTKPSLDPSTATRAHDNDATRNAPIGDATTPLATFQLSQSKNSQWPVDEAGRVS
eukprot:scaffold128_cov248-Pinguiococcus_pyrenoidosus.AAC.25